MSVREVDGQELGLGTLAELLGDTPLGRTSAEVEAKLESLRASRRFVALEGFEPRPVEDGGVVLVACPLARGAELDPAVCRVHRGLLVAIAERREQAIELVIGRPGTCRVVPAGPSPDHSSFRTDVDHSRRTR